MSKENDPWGHQPVHLLLIVVITSPLEGYGIHLFHHLSFPIIYHVKNSDKQFIIIIRIITVTFVHITLDLVPEKIEAIVTEEALLEHLWHDCHLCISSITRWFLIKRVVTLNLLKLFLSLWIFKLVGQWFRLPYQVFYFNKLPVWCHNNLKGNLISTRVMDEHPILVYHVLAPIIIANSKAIIQTWIQLVYFTVELDSPGGK